MAEETRKHHPYGPSVLSRRYHCPASRRIEDGLEDEPGEAAKAGSRIHEAIEKWVADGMPEVFPAYLEDNAEQLLFEDCCEFLDHMTTGVPRADIHAEAPLELKDIYGSVVTFGTADIVYPDAAIPGRWHIIDWKTGRGSIEPSGENWQGAAYAAMLAKSVGGPEEVEVTFFQPALRHSSSHVFTKDDLEDITDSIIDIVEAGDGPAPACKAGSWCKYCKGNLSGKCCLSRYNAEQSLFVPETYDIGGMDDVALAMEYSRASAAKDYAALLEDEIKRRCRERGEACGYTLKPRPGARVLCDPQRAFDIMSDHGLTQAAFLQCVSVSLTDLEKAYWETAKMQRPADNVTLKQAKAEVNEALLDIIARKAPSMVLTPVKGGEVES